MARRVKQGYSAPALAQFINDHVEWRGISNGNKTTVKDARFLNDTRMTADDARRLHRWSHDSEHVDLSTADRFLIRYDLALWEFEHWAAEKYGDSTYFDTESVLQ